MNTPAPTTRFPAWLLLLSALSALGPLSIDMYLPAFSAIGEGLNTNTGKVQLTLASYFIGLCLGQLVYGPLSDRFGRVKPILFGLALYTVASIGCAFASSIESLIVWRFIQAIGGCAGMVITRAIIRDRCEPMEAAKAFSVLILVMGLAPILAPLAGGMMVDAFAWPAIFIALAVFGGVIWLISLKGLAETMTSPPMPLAFGSIFSGYLSLLKNRHFVTQSLTGGLATSGMFAYITGSPFVLIELYEISPTHYSWIFGLNALGLIAGSQINAKLLGRFSLEGMLKMALWVPPLAGLTLVAAGFMDQAPLWMLLLAFFAFVSSLGFINPNSSSLALAPHGQRAGMASALMGSMQFFTATIAGVILGLWHTESVMPLAVIMALCGSGAWLMLRLVPAQPTH